MASGLLAEGVALRIGNTRAASRIHMHHMRTLRQCHRTASVGLERSRDASRAMAAVDLACRGWRERGCNEVEAAVGVLRLLRVEVNDATTRAVGRRLRTFLVQAFFLSVPVDMSPGCYLAWLPCPTMDRDERAQHLLAHSKMVPRQKKRRVRPAREQVARDTHEERRAAYDFVTASMDEVLSICH